MSLMLAFPPNQHCWWNLRTPRSSKTSHYAPGGTRDKEHRRSPCQPVSQQDRLAACLPPWMPSLLTSTTDTGARRETTASTRVVAPPIWGLPKPLNAPSSCNPNHTDRKLRLLQGISTYTHAQLTIIPFLRTSRANPSSTAQRPVLGLTVTYVGKVG